MENNAIDPVMQRVMSEQSQGPQTRIDLFKKLEEILNKPIVSFFTSFLYPVSIEDQDTDILAGILQMSTLEKGLILIISSPGGNGLAAERMINVCRTYSKTGNYTIIVPGKAKSAATMVCFGADLIMMGPTSELGPVDPQILINDGGIHRHIGAYDIVNSYNELFSGAVKEKGNIEPYLQQLGMYDASIIKNLESTIDLSKSISIRALKSGMMLNQDDKKIEKNIRIFLDPENTKNHGRPIFMDIAKECGLNVKGFDPQSPEWKLIYELYIRTNHYVSTRVSKCIETKDHSFSTPRPN